MSATAGGVAWQLICLPEEFIGLEVSRWAINFSLDVSKYDRIAYMHAIFIEIFFLSRIGRAL